MLMVPHTRAAAAAEPSHPAAIRSWQHAWWQQLIMLLLQLLLPIWLMAASILLSAFSKAPVTQLQGRQASWSDALTEEW
jgi:hypothetical protein